MRPIRHRWALTVAAFATRAIAGLTPRTSLAASPGKPARAAVATLALAFLFSLAASEAHADIALVQEIGTATANTTGTTTAISVPAAGVAAGDSIILTFTCGDVVGDFSATDSAGNTYTVDIQGTKAGLVRTAILSAHNVNTLVQNDTITVTHPSMDRRLLTADEFSGLAKASTRDQTSTGNGTGTAADSGATATTTQAIELLIGAVGTDGLKSDIFTAGNDGHGGTYTRLTGVGMNGAGSFTLNPEYEIVAATNAYHATGTLSPARDWVANVATYTADANCGNGLVDAGEDCDLGATNGIAGSCCSTSCRFRPSTRLCRAAFGECDLAVNCTGTSATCPEDASKKAAGTACTADTNPCTLDVCDGSSSTCTHPAGHQGTVCRAAVSLCDAAETCDGTSTNCPPDAVQPAGTACTADTNPCTLEVCDGTSTACQHPAGNPGAVCRAAAGPCDVAETCTGTSTTCPTNLFLPSSTECRASAGVCDVAENCTGTSATCPADTFLASSTVCRPATDLCDAVEKCTGSGVNCPADALSAAGTVCRAAVAPCDAAETCTGPSITCPADAIQPAGAVCRAAASECDVAETCNGSSTTCPTDTVMPAGRACTADTNPCTFDQCNGTSNTCQHTA